MSRQILLSKRTTSAIHQAIRMFMVGEEGIAGAALVEFTIFAPLLVVMTIYIWDFGLLIFNKLEMQNAAQAGAQWAIAHGLNNPSGIASAAKNATNLSASQIAVNLNEFCGCPSTTGVTLQNTSNPSGICSGGTTCSSGELAGNYLTVSAAPTTPYNSFIPFGLVSSVYDITATSTVRIQ